MVPDPYGHPNPRMAPDRTAVAPASDRTPFGAGRVNYVEDGQGRAAVHIQAFSRLLAELAREQSPIRARTLPRRSLASIFPPAFRPPARMPTPWGTISIPAYAASSATSASGSGIRPLPPLVGPTRWEGFSAKAPRTPRSQSPTLAVGNDLGPSSSAAGITWGEPDASPRSARPCRQGPRFRCSFKGEYGRDPEADCAQGRPVSRAVFLRSAFSRREADLRELRPQRCQKPCSFDRLTTLVGYDRGVRDRSGEIGSPRDPFTSRSGTQ